MDITTLVGFLTGTGCIVFAIMLGSGPGTFIHVPSMLIVMGGTFAATLINFPLAEILRMTKVVIKVLKSDALDPALPIPILIACAEKSRQQGLLSLEDSVDEINDEFLKLGMRLIIDGTEPGEVRDIMETELEYLAERHKGGQQLFLAMAKYSPAFGMVGTLIGLIAMLKSMSDPASIGPSMAVALITTFYGAVLANLVFMPIAGKLKARSAEESLMRRIILEGILMIQAQVNPRYIGQKLVAYLPPKWRETALEGDKGKAGGEENATNEQATNPA